MLLTIKKWWHQGDHCDVQPALDLAVAKLMVGMMSMDGKMSDQEHSEIVSLLALRFSLSVDDCENLIAKSLHPTHSSLRLNKIVKQIEKEFSEVECINLLEQLWLIAISDGDIDFLEEQYMNRLSALLGVSADALADLKAKIERAHPNLTHTHRHEMRGAMR